MGLTTSADSFETAARAFRDVNLEPVSAPCIAIQAADAATLAEVRELVEQVGAVLITSARTVEILWPSRVPDVKCLTVGAATSAAVAARGGRVEIQGEGGLSDLADKLDACGGPEIVFPHASRSDLGPLANASVTVHARAVYHTEPMSPPDVEVEAVTFGSPSAVEGWFSSRGADGMVVAAIGETTSRRLLDLGVTPDVVPDRPRFADVAQALARYVGVSR